MGWGGVWWGSVRRLCSYRDIYNVPKLDLLHQVQILTQQRLVQMNVRWSEMEKRMSENKQKHDVCVSVSKGGVACGTIHH